MKFKDWFEQAVDMLDWPSGSILGLHTLLMIGTSAYLIVLRAKHPESAFEMPSTVVDVYKFVLLNFSVVKGAKISATIFGKFMGSGDPPTPTDVPKP